VIGDIASVPSSLPLPELPLFREIPRLIVPAASLAFVGLVQGAGVSAGVPNPDGTPQDASQDFVGQGAGNILSGLFQGMPVGGSMSASSLAAGAGAKSRTAMLFAGVTMAVVIVVFASAVQRVAMPALAGLLVVVGFGTIKPDKVKAVARTGPVPLSVMVVTMVLTMLIPLQFAVLVGVAISVVLFVVGQSSRLVTRRIVFRDDGRVMETAPPDDLPVGEVVMIQPYGAIFFANTTVLLDQMPQVSPTSRHSVVVLRLRGTDDAGATLLDALAAYARSLREAESRLIVVTDNARLIRQLRRTEGIDAVGLDNVYRGTPVIGEALRDAYDDAVTWIAEQRRTSPGAEPAKRGRRGPPDRGDWPPDQMAP
jgi:SulP family sulfate permease